MSPETYALLGDAVAVLHGLVVIYIMGSVLLHTLFSRKVPDQLPGWYFWSVSIIGCIIILGPFAVNDCPLNIVEDYFRGLAGQEVHEMSFIARHVQILFGIELGLLTVQLIDMIIGFIMGLLLLLVFAKKLPKLKKYGA